MVFDQAHRLAVARVRVRVRRQAPRVPHQIRHARINEPGPLPFRVNTNGLEWPHLSQRG